MLEHRRLLPIVLVLALLIVALGAGPDDELRPGQPSIIPATSGDARPGRLLVKLDPAATAAATASIASTGSQLISLGGQDWYVIEGDPAASPSDLAGIASQLPGVLRTEPDYVRTLAYIPNEPNFTWAPQSTSQAQCDANGGTILCGPLWNMARVGAPLAWDSSTGSGVLTAILDAGFSAGGSDAPANVVTGYNAYTGTSDVTDLNGHGTHVTGTVAQRTNNGIGTVGLAFDATILPVKVCSPTGGPDCSDSALITGINVARQRGARIMNMSLGGSQPSAALNDAVNAALDAGIVLVAAMGNQAQAGSPISYPAAIPGVIGVGATRWDNQRSFYSNLGSHIWLAAPGGEGPIDQNGDGLQDLVYQQTLGSNCGMATSFANCGKQGTSMATPHVTATVALMLQRNASLRPADVRSILASTAQDLAATGFDNATGHGLLRADRAVAAAVPTPPVTPIVCAPNPAPGSATAALPTFPVPYTGNVLAIPVLLKRCYGGW